MRLCESIKADQDSINMSKTQMESGRQQLALYEGDTMASACYKNLDDVRYGIKNISQIA